MRMLLIHADYFKYEVREKAIEEPEETDESNKTGEQKEVLVAFCTIEGIDEKDPEQVSINAAKSIEEVAELVKTKSVFIYPYAHLSKDLASKETAIPVLRSMEELLVKKGFNVKRSPFGWYKSFTISCKGHPISELSRTILPEKTEEKKPVRTKYMVMDLSGKLYNPEEYECKETEEEFKALVEKEAFKRGLVGGEPRFLDYCKKFGIGWESYSDLGHMRYEPEASLIFDLISEYSWQVASSLGIPIFQVKGTNMFDLSIKAVKEHADLFGSRLYEVKVDEKSFVLRYAACHQQFSIVKDWSLSYKNLPFGTFEIADSYRLEQSGELLLCFRVRKLHMPDLHIYCKDLDEAKEVSMDVHKKIYEEIKKLGRDYVSIYNTTESFFEENREYFLDLIKIEKKPILLNFVPENVYYWVINVEYTVIDELKRPREIATFQIDMGNSKRFGISYIDQKGQRKFPPIIHTALLGTIERYIFTVLDCAVRLEDEGKKPSLPLWLSPIQVRIIPVSKDHVDYALSLAEKLEKMNVRVDVDDREGTVQKRVRDAEVSWIPYIAVVGKKELSMNKFPVRVRETDSQKIMSIEEINYEIRNKTLGYPFKPLTLPKLLSRRPIYK
ncbi:MAG: threonine--tRNA ligase [Candidatus Bathyarchaeia archaeon]